MWWMFYWQKNGLFQVCNIVRTTAVSSTANYIYPAHWWSSGTSKYLSQHRGIAICHHGMNLWFCIHWSYDHGYLRGINLRGGSESSKWRMVSYWTKGWVYCCMCPKIKHMPKDQLLLLTARAKNASYLHMMYQSQKSYSRLYQTIGMQAYMLEFWRSLGFEESACELCIQLVLNLRLSIIVSVIQLSGENFFGRKSLRILPEHHYCVHKKNSCFISYNCFLSSP